MDYVHIFLVCMNKKKPLPLWGNGFNLVQEIIYVELSPLHWMNRNYVP